MKNTARFITFEGIDGAGKSTHVAALATWLRDQGLTVKVTREPGGTDLAEALRELVLKQSMDMLSEALLVFAARRDHLRQVIEPALASGDVVLCDRFTDATFAYQGAGRGLSLDVLMTLESWVQEGRQPDITLWFDADPTLAASRRSQVRSPDRFEGLDEAFFKRVQAGYAQRAQAAPRRFVKIDANRSREAVWGSVVDTMASKRWW